MQVKDLHLAFNYRLFGPNRRDTGNELLTELCPERVFSCLFLSELTCFNLIEITVNQLVCYRLRKFAFWY
jgi:hypothetical protein